MTTTLQMTDLCIYTYSNDDGVGCPGAARPAMVLERNDDQHFYRIHVFELRGDSLYAPAYNVSEVYLSETPALGKISPMVPSQVAALAVDLASTTVAMQALMQEKTQYLTTPTSIAVGATLNALVSPASAALAVGWGVSCIAAFTLKLTNLLTSAQATVRLQRRLNGAGSWTDVMTPKVYDLNGAVANIVPVVASPTVPGTGVAVTAGDTVEMRLQISHTAGLSAFSLAEASLLSRFAVKVMS